MFEFTASRSANLWSPASMALLVTEEIILFMLQEAEMAQRPPSQRGMPAWLIAVSAICAVLGLLAVVGCYLVGRHCNRRRAAELVNNKHMVCPCSVG